MGLLRKCMLVEAVLRLMASCVCTNAQTLTSRPNFPPAIFAFGDSMIDPGNNNFIDTLSKANFPYNGLDFPTGPTGRFCNGRTVIDIICDIFQVPYLRPYLDPLTDGIALLRGVNYGSGAGGILNATGANFIRRVPFDEQISYFKHTLGQLTEQLGKAESAVLVSKSLVCIVIGSNDFINNYLLSTTNTSKLFTPAQFTALLIQKFSSQLLELYDLGLRKIFVSGIGPLGCIPHQLALAQSPECVQTINDQVQDFNNGLGSLLDQLNSRLPGATLLFGNIYDSLTSLITNPVPHGFQVVNEGCCGSGLYRGQFPCQPTASVCYDRSQYVFWDPYHTTESANVILADGLYDGGPDQISPINIHQLIDLPGG